jgi:pteridine reductase
MGTRPLTGKTALITGAARRIGRETALTLAEEGANVVVHYRRSEAEAKELVRELEQRGVKAWTVQADFEKPEEYETLIERSLQMAGVLDFLVNNASEFPMDTLDTLDFAGLVSNVQVNAWVPFVLTRAFAQKIGRGKVVNLVDSRIRGSDWQHVGYILSKHSLAVLTRMTALQYAPNVTVNAVAPGLILPPPGKPESYIDALASTVPLRKHGDPQDIADAIVFLLKSDFITGHVIYVDGGRHLKEYVGTKRNDGTPRCAAEKRHSGQVVVDENPRENGDVC